MEQQDKVTHQEQNYNDLPQKWRTRRDHRIDKIFGNINKGVSTRLNLKGDVLNMNFVSQIEPSKINDTLDDKQWILVM